VTGLAAAGAAAAGRCNPYARLASLLPAMRSLCLILALALLLSACGQKGPLYLPDQKPVKKDRTKQ
jgi:hypothetical protein